MATKEEIRIKNIDYYYQSKIDEFYNFLKSYFTDDKDYGNSEVRGLLFSLSHSNTDLIIGYMRLFKKLAESIAEEYFRHVPKKSCPVLNINGRSIKLDAEAYRNGELRYIFDYIITFILKKDNINKSAIFVDDFCEILSKLVDNNIEINECFMEFMYSASKEEIKTMLFL